MDWIFEGSFYVCINNITMLTKNEVAEMICDLELHILCKIWSFSDFRFNFY